MFPKKSPTNEKELLISCQNIEGISFQQLALEHNLAIPLAATKRKGWVGQAIEIALGTTAGNLALPDFHHLGVELKTIPLDHNGKPSESTYVTSIPLLTIQQQRWLSSTCFNKLKKVLWIPIEGDNSIPYNQRRIGKAMLWTPSVEQEKTLADDWEELVEMISTGQLAQLSAAVGRALHVRPKASNAKSLCYGFDAEGTKIQTLPRGFYLRTAFTNTILSG